MRSKGHNQSNKFMRFITVPIRVLGKARDLYVRSLTNCSQTVSCGGGSMSTATGEFSALPRSFSASSSRSDDAELDYRELIRAASVRGLGHRNETDMLLHHQIKKSMVMGPKGLPKSCSVAMGRIDEEEPSDFGDQDDVSNKTKADLLYPRSKSYAVRKRGVFF